MPTIFFIVLLTRPKFASPGPWNLFIIEWGASRGILSCPNIVAESSSTSCVRFLLTCHVCEEGKWVSYNHFGLVKTAQNHFGKAIWNDGFWHLRRSCLPEMHRLYSHWRCLHHPDEMIRRLAQSFSATIQVFK